jgi:hypothetical protein
MKRILAIIALASGLAYADSITQPLGPVTAVAGTGTTALQCVFTNNSGVIGLNCTINGAPAYQGTVSPVVIPMNTTGLLASLGANNNSVTWVFTPGATAGVFNYSITANMTVKTGQI